MEFLTHLFTQYPTEPISDVITWFVTHAFTYGIAWLPRAVYVLFYGY